MGRVFERMGRKDYIHSLETFQSIQLKMDFHKVREWILKESIQQVLEEMGIQKENHSQISSLSKEEYEFLKMQLRFLPNPIQQRFKNKIPNYHSYENIWATYDVFYKKNLHF